MSFPTLPLKALGASGARHWLRPLLVLLLVAASPLAEAGVGDVDPNYGVNGRFEARRYEASYVFPVLADGRVLYRDPDTTYGGYLRTDVNGLPDATFGTPWPEGYAAGGVWARTREGNLLVALDRWSARGGFEHAVMRLGPDGRPDPAFGAIGLVMLDVPGDGTERAQSLLVQPDGKLLLLLAGRDADDGYTLVRVLLIRLMPDGRLDPTFGRSGSVDVPLANPVKIMDGVGMSLLTDGRIVVEASPAIYLTGSGAAESSPPPGTTSWAVAWLLPDGGAIASASTSTGHRIAKVRQDGSFDGTFGPNGDGTVVLPQDSTGSADLWGASASSDGRYIFLSGAQYSRAGWTVSRLFGDGPMAGRLDPSFGKQGTVDLKSTSVHGVVHGLTDGSAIVTTSDYAYRLLGRADPSPGFTGPVDGEQPWLEGGTVEIRVFRAAGSNGAIRLRYWTLAQAELPQGATKPATPGTDFDAVSGVLDWSDGDDGDKLIRIPVRKDGDVEGTEQIYVGLEALTPGTWNVAPLVAVAINDTTATPTSPGNPPAAGGPPTVGGQSNGGGAFGWPGLLLLAAAAIAGRRRGRGRRPMGRTMHTTVLRAAACLLFAAPGATHATPGVVDPEFLYPGPAAPLPDSTTAVRLPDGWLVVQSRPQVSPVEPSRLMLTRTDRDGRIDAGFGSMGRLTVALPVDLNVATAARRLADGSVLLGGLRVTEYGEDSAGAVVRLDPQGRLDPGFGEQGVATIDVSGQLDRVGAIESLPDGRLALLVWSRSLYNPYGDCAEDQTSLVILDADGRNWRVESAQLRNSFGTSSCRNQMTLQLQSDGTPVYGNELGIFAAGFTPVLTQAWRYGPFVLDTPLGSFFTTASGASINVQRLGVDRPMGNDDYEGLGATVGLCGPVTWNRLVADPQRQRLYLGLESDGGQVAIARFRVDGSIDTGWGGNGIVAINGGQCLAAVEGLASGLRLLSVEPDGDIVVATADGTFQRLAGGEGTAQGAFTLRAPRNVVAEGNYSLTVAVPRLGGATGLVSVNYRVTDCNPAIGLECSAGPHWGNARPGEDFVAASGRLDWSDGDSTERLIQVQLLDDNIEETPEWFYVQLSDPGGGAELLSRSARIYIDASDKAGADPIVTPPAPAPEPKSAGGSGSAGVGLMLLLLSTAAARLGRRRSAAAAVRVVHCSYRRVSPIRLPSP